MHPLSRVRFESKTARNAQGSAESISKKKAGGEDEDE
jgi:hypothetical protein